MAGKRLFDTLPARTDGSEVKPAAPWAKFSDSPPLATLVGASQPHLLKTHSCRTIAQDRVEAQARLFRSFVIASSRSTALIHHAAYLSTASTDCDGLPVHNVVKGHISTFENTLTAQPAYGLPRTPLLRASVNTHARNHGIAYEGVHPESRGGFCSKNSCSTTSASSRAAPAVRRTTLSLLT